jgi:hypothetical protein
MPKWAKQMVGAKRRKAIGKIVNFFMMALHEGSNEKNRP